MIRNLFILSVFLVRQAVLASPFDKENLHDLSDYTPPDGVYHSLEIRAPGLSIESSARERMEADIDTAQSIGGRLNGDLTHLFNHHTRKLTFTSRNRAHSSISKNSDEESTTLPAREFYNYRRYQVFDLRVFSNDTLLIHNKSNFFLGAFFSADYQFFQRNERYVGDEYGIADTNLLDITKIKRRRSDSHQDGSASLSLGAGYGRIENIDYAVTASHLLAKLIEQKKLRMVPNTSGLYELARTIEGAFRERGLDSREKRISNMARICRFMRSSGLIDSVTPEIAFTLADEIDYTGAYRRQSGMRCGLNLEGSHGRWWNREKSKEELYRAFIPGDTSDIPRLRDFSPDSFAIREINEATGNWSNTNTYAILFADHSHYLNRFWSLDGNASLKWGYEFQRDSLIRRQPHLSALLDWGLSFYPNSRSKIGLNFNAFYDRYFDFIANTDAVSGTTLIEDRRNLMVGGGIGATRYVSPQLSWSLNFGLDWEDSYFGDSYRQYSSQFLNWRLSGGATYKLF